MKKGLLACAGVCVVMLAACSSPAPVTGPVDGKFLSTATTACADALQQVDTTPFPWANFNSNHPLAAQLPAVGSYFDSQAFNHKELQFVQLFGTPKRGRQTWQQFVYLVAQQQNDVGGQIEAADAANPTAYVATVNKIALLGKQIDSAAAAVGFAKGSACVQLFG